MAEEKVHEPSKRKLQKCRKEGVVLRSRGIVECFQVVTIAAGLYLFSCSGLVKFKMLLEYCLVQDVSGVAGCASLGLRIGMSICAFCLIFGGLSSILVEAIQVRPRFDAELIAFKADNFNLGSGLKRILRGVATSWQSLLKLALLGVCTCRFLFQAARGIGEMSRGRVEETFLSTLAEVLDQAWLIAPALLVVVLLDAVIQLRRYRRDVMMTREELRREIREDEGDPHIRAARRGLMRQLTYGELVERLKKTKVLIVERRGTS
ncbi:MAG: EscU/YscU/HrcU family type III secretion system export apparatus switch protein [Oligoflexia bacterium]|nr:EscU/YscU/HrcU family type III secretion system export apparatus switch protein [Oligoflexia bacterium]